METCHAVNLSIDIRNETETVFALGCARHGKRLELVVKRLRKVCHAHPLVLAIHRALHHEQGVGKAHDGLQVEIETHTATTTWETTFVVAVGLPGAEHQVLAVLHRHGRSEQISLLAVATKHAAHAGHTLLAWVLTLVRTEAATRETAVGILEVRKKCVPVVPNVGL